MGGHTGNRDQWLSKALQQMWWHTQVALNLSHYIPSIYSGALFLWLFRYLILGEEAAGSGEISRAVRRGVVVRFRIPPRIGHRFAI